jgi:orotate phosphoribosyltransferase/uridine monophosphate synthetase
MLNPQVAPFQLAAGVPFGGLHLATAYSLTAKVPLIYIRPKSMDGVGIEGLHEAGQSVLVIDDLITGGHSILDTADGCERRDFVVDAVVRRPAAGWTSGAAKGGYQLTSLRHCRSS